ncbi:flagellar M-ring protein FliF [Tepidamorphus gemmatus]|uniref:Flagellar M-ring protein n=1 Tax=Tepidamorphus gemmatus TaxID=747076 RepID=A0A4R3MIF4_9HYPH|nr:flagellar M-ring protein FliF [Tepidamorphus gemmatus]
MPGRGRVASVQAPIPGQTIVSVTGYGNVQVGLEFLKSLGAARLAAMGAVAAALIGFFAFLIIHLSAVKMVPLYTDLDFEDSGAVVRELERRGIAYELRYEGSTVLVPEPDVLRLRMDLASSGLPSGGGVGYEIFDRGDTLGATSFVQGINHLRALEGELARTIRALDRVASARVHLVIPERRLFARDTVPPSASIVLKTRGALSETQIRAIRHLVASAVEGMTPGRVAIVDEAGRLLADGDGDADAGSLLVLDNRRQAIEAKMRSQIEDILASIVGPDRVRVQVTAELEHNRVTQTVDQFDPDGRVVRSSQLREETSNVTEPADNGGVTVGNELPGANAEAAGMASENTSRSEEVTNYEISRTTKTEVIEPGRIRRLSVAVVVDGIYTQNANGELVYEPRPQEQLDRLAALVRSAVGFDQERGDTVEIANLRFAEGPRGIPTEEETSFLPALSSAELMRLVELGVLFLVALLVLLFVARPLVRRILSPEATAPIALEAPATANAEAPGLVAQLEGPAGTSLALPPSPTEDAIDFAQQIGEVQQSSLRKVGELIDQNPTEALNIIRNWIHAPAAS